MKKILHIILLLFSVSIYSQDISIPNTFNAGDIISATQMNSNFQLLVDEINTLKTLVTNQSETITTLQTDLNTAESTITTLETNYNNIKTFPIGTVVSSMLDPITFTSEMGDEWVLADGRTASVEYLETFGVGNIPDLRGQFLRGLNEGRSDGNEDPDGASRSVGDIQNDSMQGHNHEYNYTIMNYASGSSATIAAPRSNWNSSTLMSYQYKDNSLIVDDPTSDGTNGTPRVSSETRPKNTSVYWYIKIK